MRSNKKKIIVSAIAVSALFLLISNFPGDPSYEGYSKEPLDSFTIDTEEAKLFDDIASEISDNAEVYSLLCYTKGEIFPEGTYKIKLNLAVFPKENDQYSRDCSELALYVNDHVSASGYALIYFEEAKSKYKPAQRDVLQVFFSPMDIFPDNIAEFDPSSVKIGLGAYPRICKSKPDGAGARLPEKGESGFTEEQKKNIALTQLEYEKAAFDIMNYAAIYMTLCQVNGTQLQNGEYLIDLFDKESFSEEYTYDGREVEAYITENMRDTFGYAYVKVVNNEPVCAYYSEKDFGRNISMKNEYIIGAYPDKAKTRINGIDYDKYAQNNDDELNGD